MADEVLNDLPVLQQSVSDDVNGAEDYTIVYQLDIPDDSERQTTNQSEVQQLLG